MSRSARTALDTAPRPRPTRLRRAVGMISAFAVATVGAVTMSAAPVAFAATDTDPSFRLIPADLEFILRQIEISEAHAAGGELLCDDPTDTTGKCVPDPTLPYGLRTVDGSYNNLVAGREHFGSQQQEEQQQQQQQQQQQRRQ